MLNIAHAEDAYLLGSAQFQEWLAEFEREWYRPLGMMMVGALINSLPPEVEAQLNPETLGRIKAALRGKGQYGKVIR